MDLDNQLYYRVIYINNIYIYIAQDLTFLGQFGDVLTGLFEFFSS